MGEEKKGAGIPSWMKDMFFKAGNHFITKALVKVVAKVGLSLSGPLGWLASFFIDKILRKLWDGVVYVWTWFAEKLETRRELKKYREQIDKPGATPEEIKDAGKDFLSS